MSFAFVVIRIYLSLVALLVPLQCEWYHAFSDVKLLFQGGEYIVLALILSDFADDGPKVSLELHLLLTSW